MTEPQIRTNRVPAPCRSCGTAVQAWEAFCEGCGAQLTPIAQAPATDPERPVADSRSVHLPKATDPSETLEPVAEPRPCRECGGTVDPDGYCEQCGARAPSEREHWSESPADWVGGVCDRGIRHSRNEDAMAITVEDAGQECEGGRGRAVLVVCDGVSSSEDSDVASLAAARAARELIRSRRPSGLGVAASRHQATLAVLAEAVLAANDAVIDTTAPTSRNAASCTFAAAIVDGRDIAHGSLGDSRIYWLADEGDSHQLSVDDSVAQLQMAAGVSREQAENGPQAHAITKWLGRDAPDPTPTGGVFQVPGDGWLVVCSDGLWNYASAPADLEAQVARLLLDDPGYADPTRLAEGLVAWANAQGGKDNITVALARFGAPPTHLAGAASAGTVAPPGHT